MGFNYLKNPAYRLIFNFYVSIFDQFTILLHWVRLMRPATVIVVIVFFLISLTAGSRVTNLSVTTEGRDIKVSWEMLDQVGVQHFNVERRTIDQANFIRINDRSIPLNNGRKYDYFDRNIYKLENAVVFYRIAIVEANGNVYYSEAIPLGKISSVQRTWGSIKSMFR
jgi:hypothetical protein